MAFSLDTQRPQGRLRAQGPTVSLSCRVVGEGGCFPRALLPAPPSGGGGGATVFSTYFSNRKLPPGAARRLGGNSEVIGDLSHN